jgi:hypothetical protein
MTKIFSSIVIAVVFLSACKKYEDNPLINLRSKEWRLYGTYHIDLYTIDGQDARDSIYQGAAFGCNTVAFYHEGAYQNVLPHGSWWWKDSKRKLELAGTEFIDEQHHDWMITKLTDHQLHLKASADNKNYVLFLHSK